MFLRKIPALCLALILCVSLVCQAQAETEYPPRPQGTVADLAGVLGEKTIQDAETLSARLQDAAGGQLYVLTRHFLGGADAQQYADKVFEVWSLTSQDALLLMVIGEEDFALSLGGSAKSALPTEARNTLLGAFRNTFRQREYDAALADLSLSLGQTLAKAAGSSLDASGLFGAAAVQSTPQPQSVSDFWYGMFARDDYDSKENDQENIWQEWQSEWQHEESRVNWRGIIIWALVIYFLFFRRKKHRR